MLRSNSHKRTTIRNKVLPSAICLSLIALAGCSGNADETSGSKDPVDGQLTPIAVGGIMAAPNAAIEVGQDEGVWERAGLSVEFNTGIDGPEQLPALVTESIDFSICNPTSLLLARDQGLDIRVVAGFNISSEASPEGNAVIVRADSDIDSFSDLDGKTVAVNAIRTQADVMIMEAVQLQGGDPTEVDFIEIAFPDMPAQLNNANTDAFWAPEPFVTMAAQSSEFEVLGYPILEVEPGSPVQMFCANGSLVDEYPELITQFQSAVSELTELVAQDESAVRAELPEFSEIPPELAETMYLDVYEASIPMETLDTTNQLMYEYGMTSEPADLDEVVVHDE